jgi:hypothetical protein
VPDWVCEVLSPGNPQNDLTLKRRAYHAAKVGYYWIVDPMREEITVLRWNLDGYTIVEADALATVEVGDGASHLQDAIMGARRQTQFIDRLAKQPQRLRRSVDMLTQPAWF